MKKTIKYLTIATFTLLLTSNCNSEEKNKSKSSKSSAITEFDSKSNKVIEGNINKINLEKINWSSNFSSSDIKGEWIQIIWFNPKNESDKTYFIDGDEEQKKLTLSSNIYQTSTIAGGENPEFKYKIVKDRLIVTTKSKLASEIFNYRVSISEDKKILQFLGKYEAKVYKRK